MATALSALKKQVSGLQMSSKTIQDSHVYSMALFKSTTASRIKTFQAELKFQVAEFLAQESDDSLCNKENESKAPDSVERLYAYPPREVMNGTIDQLKALAILAQRVQQEVVDKYKSQSQDQCLEIARLKKELCERDFESGILLDKIRAAQDLLMSKSLEFDTELLELRATNARQSEELGQKNNLVNNLEYQLETERARFQLFEQQYVSAIAALEDHTKQIQSLTECNKVCCSTIKELKVVNERLLVDKENLAGSFLDCRTEKQRLENKITEMEPLLANGASEDLSIVLRIELEKLRETHQKDRRRLQLTIADLQEELDRLKSERPITL